jgi:hypothetical protein
MIYEAARVHAHHACTAVQEVQGLEIHECPFASPIFQRRGVADGGQGLTKAKMAECVRFACNGHSARGDVGGHRERRSRTVATNWAGTPGFRLVVMQVRGLGITSGVRALSVNTKQVNVQTGSCVVLVLRLPQLELAQGRE